VDELAPLGDAELQATFAKKYPLRIITRLLGIPRHYEDKAHSIGGLGHLTDICDYDIRLPMRFTPREGHTKAGVELTRAILATFRFNEALLQAGDDLIRDLGVSSARWQVLGTINDGPLPVAQIARDLGRKRQGVQPTVDRLLKQGLVELRENPNHRRAKLVALTPKGRSVLDEINERQESWVNALAEGLPLDALRQVVLLARLVGERLNQQGGTIWRSHSSTRSRSRKVARKKR
jgi:DNA-binding MarR family transcriptional regulator